MGDSQRAAQRLWNRLDCPPEFNNQETAVRWSVIMGDCLGESELGIETFLEFIHFVCKTHAWSAEYLRNAKDPASTLKKNLPNLLKRFRAFQAALNAKAERNAILSQKTKAAATCKCGRPKPCEVHDLKVQL
jgi:hypothetical protein